MKPTVGRIVHYYTTLTDEQVAGQGEGPYAAIVTQVMSGTMTNLTVYPPLARPFPVGSVMEKAEAAAKGHNVRWYQWPDRVS